MDMLTTHTDATLIEELGRRIAATRVDRGLTQAALAFEAGISKRTLERLESGDSIQLAGFLRVLRALGLTQNLNALLPVAAESPMRLLEVAAKPRRRARGKPQRGEKPPFRWGDQ